MNIDEKIKQLIKERIEKLQTHLGRDHFTQNPNYPEQQKEKDLQNIEERIKKLGIVGFSLFAFGFVLQFVGILLQVY